MCCSVKPCLTLVVYVQLTGVTWICDLCLHVHIILHYNISANHLYLTKKCSKHLTDAEVRPHFTRFSCQLANRWAGICTSASLWLWKMVEIFQWIRHNSAKVTIGLRPDSYTIQWMCVKYPVSFKRVVIGILTICHYLGIEICIWTWTKSSVIFQNLWYKNIWKWMVSWQWHGKWCASV